MVSVDSLKKNQEFADKEQANFPLLSDETKKVAKAYGVLNAFGLASRVMIFIGPDGKVLHIETTGHTRDAGEFLAKKLDELKVKKR